MSVQVGAMSTQPSTDPTAKCRCGYALFEGQTCPECGLPYEQATAPPPGSRLWLASPLSLILSFIGASVFPCTCGHLGREALFVLVPAALLAWWPFLFAREHWPFPRLGTIAAALASTLLLAKNVADILWFGHEPLL